jgi:hypothetical protein
MGHRKLEAPVLFDTYPALYTLPAPEPEATWQYLAMGPDWGLPVGEEVWMKAAIYMHPDGAFVPVPLSAEDWPLWVAVRLIRLTTLNPIPRPSTSRRNFR